jgi:flagellar hook-length control protein FliK
MRITGADPANDPNANVDSNSPRKSDNDATTSFAKVLSKKQQAQDDAQFAGGKPGKGDPAMATLTGEPGPLETPADAPSIEEKHLVPIPPQLQELVREISVVVNAPGQQQVHIELNSNVLKGLHISIQRQDGAVAIQFQSSSDDVATLLAKNSNALADALVERGVTLKDIRIAGPETTDNRQHYKNPFGGRGPWQGSSRQGRR